MKKNCWKVCLLAGALCLLWTLSGCKSEGYYQAQAVEEAREFLLNEARDIPLMDQEYIKFNRPFLMVSHLGGSYSTGVAQICVCWMTPSSPEVYMVFGTSGMRMADWSPIRVVRKSFTEPQRDYLLTAQAAANTILQQQFGLLSVPSVNHIRYTMPGLWVCKFPLNLNPGTEYDEDALEEAEKLPRYVLAWRIKEKNGVFYCIYGGTADDDTLKNFKFYFSGIYSEADFKSNLLNEEAVIEPFGGTAMEESGILL